MGGGSYILVVAYRTGKNKLAKHRTVHIAEQPGENLIQAQRKKARNFRHRNRHPLASHAAGPRCG